MGEDRGAEFSLDKIAQIEIDDAARLGVSAASLACFVGIVWWAYSPRNRARSCKSSNWRTAMVLQEMKVIAEGVETQRQCDFMEALGATEIQGYFISKPITATDIEALVPTFLHSPGN